MKANQRDTNEIEMIFREPSMIVQQKNRLNSKNRCRVPWAVNVSVNPVH